MSKFRDSGKFQKIEQKLAFFELVVNVKNLYFNPNCGLFLNLPRQFCCLTSPNCNRKLKTWPLISKRQVLCLTHSSTRCGPVSYNYCPRARSVITMLEQLQYSNFRYIIPEQPIPLIFFYIQWVKRYFIRHLQKISFWRRCATLYRNSIWKYIDLS